MEDMLGKVEFGPKVPDGNLNEEIRKLRESICELPGNLEDAIKRAFRNAGLGGKPALLDDAVERMLDAESKEHDFEYVPEWVKVGVAVKVFYDGEWWKGVVRTTCPPEDRGMEITTEKTIPATGLNYLSIMVYMTERSDEDWDRLLVKESLWVPKQEG